jgi:hypothetical protein
VIRPLRVRHRRVSAALAVLVPIGWTAALLARPGQPALGDAPLVSDARASAAPIASITAADFGPWGELPLGARLGTDDAGRALVEFQERAPLLEADLLVYWSPEGELSSASLLLGRLGRGPARWPLPRPGGWLVLYDLARGESLAARAVPGAAEEP